MVRVTVNADAARAFLGGCAGRVRDQGPLWRVVGVELRRGILRNFRVGGEFPEKWIPSKKATGRTLIERATLRNSMHARSGRDYAAAGTNVVYGGIHQFGGMAGRGRSVHIPARPFLPVDSAGKLDPRIDAFIDAAEHNWIVNGEPRP